MATIGLKHPVFAPITSFNEAAKPTYGSGFVVGKAVKANVTVSTTEGKLYADDSLAEYASQISDVSIGFETDDISDNNKCSMFGYTKVTSSGGKSGLKKGALDDDVHGGFGYYKTKVKNGTNFYCATWYYDTIFHETGESSETKGDNVNFQTISCEGKALPIIGFGNNDYCEETTFTTEAEAISWLHTNANISGASTTSASAPSTTSNK